MTKNKKTGIGIGVATLLALAVAIPVFSDVDVKKLKVNEAFAKSVYKTDEQIVENVVPEEETDDDNAFGEEIALDADETADGTDDIEEAEKTTDGDYIVAVTENYIDIKTPKHGEIYQINIDSVDTPEFDINKYDEDLQKVAKEYLDKGYYLSDAEFNVNVWGSGIGYATSEDEDFVYDRLFTNGFDVVDENNGNNTFYIEVLKMTPDEFNQYMNSGSGVTDWTKTEEGSVAKYELSDESGTVTITYDKETEVFIFKNEFPEASSKAVG